MPDRTSAQRAEDAFLNNLERGYASAQTVDNMKSTGFSDRQIAEAVGQLSRDGKVKVSNEVSPKNSSSR